MGDRLEIEVKGLPVAQARHRDRVVTTKAGQSFVQRYTPTQTRAWREMVLRAARATRGFPAEPWSGGIRLSMEAFFERPQRLNRARDPDGPIRKNSKPDADNLVKAVMDALTPPKLKWTGNAVTDDKARREQRRGYLWHDDGQVHLGSINRYYAAKGCGPGVIITVETIQEIAAC